MTYTTNSSYKPAFHEKHVVVFVVWSYSFWIRNIVKDLWRNRK